MNSNYPMGSANDPRAPWNEQPGTETGVTVRAVLVKETVLPGVHTHTCMDYDYDPDTGRSVPTCYTETDDLRECYENLEHTPGQTLERCVRVCRQLLEDGHRFYAHVNIGDLMSECDDWEMESLEVESEK